MINIKHVKLNIVIYREIRNIEDIVQHVFKIYSFQIRSKTKEIDVRDFINATYEGFQHDKPLYTPDCDCTIRRRIDHRKLINNTILCIETDENQHKYYSKQDEGDRYNDAYMGFAAKWIWIKEKMIRTRILLYQHG
jgi:hypothetical protein